MATRRRRRKTGHIKPWAILAVVMIMIAGIVGVIVLASRYSPSKEVTDLEKYYNLTIAPLQGRDAAAENEMAIVLEEEILNERAFLHEGTIYISHELVKTRIDERFYFDDNEEMLIFTNALQNITVLMDQSSYTIDDQRVETDYVILIEKKDKIYLAVKFVEAFSSVQYQTYEEPPRLVITHKIGEKTFVDAKKKTWIRERGGIKSGVVGTIKSGDKLQVIEDLDDWLEVVSAEGWVGYVATSAVKDKYTEVVVSDYDEPEYTSLNMGETVKLGWAGVFVADANDRYNEYTRDADGILNVYSPTWYFLKDGQGKITMLSDAEIVRQAHQDGYLVWALFSDEDYDFVEQALTHTSVRREMVKTLIADMKEKDIDGVNVDFERIMAEYGDDFIQFIRELSVECRKESLYLTVDNYTPYEFNACYHIEEQGRICDYVIIMVYDDYVGSGKIGPNSSLPFVRKSMDLSTSKVASEKLIAALPFYSRFWFTDNTVSTDDADNNGDSNKPKYSRKEYSMSKAWELLEQMNVTAQWNAEDGLDYAHYDYGNETVDAWLESADSIREKLNTVKQYNLGGVAFWQLGQERSTVWEHIAAY
ncbi:MAG: glycosyl hydrolase family 18 protein [Lachnospiraceae bacterium]|jgi:spore germination protein YaaH